MALPEHAETDETAEREGCARHALCANLKGGTLAISRKLHTELNTSMEAAIDTREGMRFTCGLHA